MRWYSVDRADEDMVVLICGDGTETHAPRAAFSAVPKEGDIVRFSRGFYRPKKRKTQEKRAQANAMLDAVLGEQEKNSRPSE